MKVSFTSIDQSSSLYQCESSQSNAAQSVKNYNFRKATVLDIPYIFGLIQEGSLIGSFTNSLMTSKGYRFTLKSLFLDVIPLLRIFVTHTEKTKLNVFSLNNKEIGFIRISQPTNNENVQVIELCAIDPVHRNQNYGATMLQMYLDSLPNGTEVIAHCTKYSRAMQHLLIRKKFLRDKHCFPLKTFRLVKGDNTW